MIEPPPSFKNPPLVEVAASLQFTSIEGFSNAHLGIFWQAVQGNYPKVRDADVIANQSELFGDELRRARLPHFRIAIGEAAARLQMWSRDDQSMIQLQNGRLVCNWRRSKGSEYPRWPIVRSRLYDSKVVFDSLLNAHNLPPIEVNQWEVTYLNHLEHGRDWHSPSDWPVLLPGLLGHLTNGAALVRVDRFHQPHHPAR